MSQELVKERVLKYLIEDLFVPQDMIDTNVSLNEFEEGAEGILDIVVNVKDKQGYFAPVLIVRCTDDDVALEGDTLQKEIEFLEYVDNITMAGRMILTNGDQMMYADWTGEEYDTEASLPTYEQMEREFFEAEEMLAQHEHHHHDGCGCGHDHDHDHHHHHHADEVFTSWGKETPRKYTKEEVETILKALSADNNEYGIILRAKGMLPSQDGTWIYFDMVPEEYEIREGQPEYTGRLCVIGSKIDEAKLEKLFML